MAPVKDVASRQKLHMIVMQCIKVQVEDQLIHILTQREIIVRFSMIKCSLTNKNITDM